MAGDLSQQYIHSRRSYSILNVHSLFTFVLLRLIFKRYLFILEFLCTHIPSQLNPLERIFNFLQCPPRCLRENEEDVQGHSEGEDCKNDISLPSDVDKSRRNEIAQSEIERPVAGCGQGSGFAS